MDNAMNKKGWIWYGAGFSLQLLTQIVSMVLVPLKTRMSIAGYFWITGAVQIALIACLIFGLRLIAQARGRSPAWGWLGLLHFLIGPLNIISAFVVARLDDFTAAIWHYRVGDNNYGPFSLDAIRILIKQATLSHDTPIWRVGKKEWVPASLAWPNYFRSIPPPPHQISTTKAMPSALDGATALASTSPAQMKTGMSIASLVCGIIGGVFSTASIPAIICGHIALFQIKKDPDAYGGKKMAIAGLVLGYIGFVLAIILGTMKGILWSQVIQLRQMGY